MSDTELRAAMAVAADALASKAAHFYAGVESAEVRILPGSPGGCAVRMTFQDGQVMWLVAEED